ncbi:MAG: aspartate carbamoyltransferase regulatory subunit [Planctomycetes bacterium]|nr:aspartate carbamoyltransferase regulatory subunit [Planctomycetota bacterium]
MKERDGSGAHKVRQVEAIASGTVIDHIPAAMTLKVVNLLAEVEDQVFVGINLRSSRVGRKGVVKIAGRELPERTVSSLALIAPQATISIIRDYEVIAKYQVPMPDVFADIARCDNPNCVTNHERWPTRMEVVLRDPLTVRCTYCERTFAANELSLI